jgi:hypothetical protein
MTPRAQSRCVERAKCHRPNEAEAPTEAANLCGEGLVFHVLVLVLVPVGLGIVDGPPGVFTLTCCPRLLFADDIFAALSVAGVYIPHPSTVLYNITIY